MPNGRNASTGDAAHGWRSWRRRAAGASAVAAALLALAALTMPAALAATLFSDDFEDGNSSGWTTSGGTWSVVADGSLVFRQAGTSADALARAGSSSWTAYTVTAQVKPTAFGGSDRFVALLARAQSNTSYYFLALRADNTLVLGKRVSGTLTTLASASQTVTTGTTYALSLTVSGSALTGSVTGGPTLNASDGQFASGQIGFATRFAAGEIDNVLVTSGVTPSPTPTQSATPTPTPTASATPTPNPTPSPTPTGSCSPPPDMEGWATVSGNGHGPTTGGCGGPTVTVTSLAQLQTEAGRTTPEIIMVNGLFTGSGEVTVQSNKTVIGVGASSGLTGIGLSMQDVSNVIVRNMNISKVTASSGAGDAIHIQHADHIWIDHNSLSSDLDSGHDFYDGLVDITHAGDFVTVSWNHNFNHFKDSLLGHSDGNAAEDTGHLKVTYHHNWYDSSRERHPRVRFGETVHVFDNYVLNAAPDYGVASTENAGLLVEDNVFENVGQACFSASGFAASGPGRLVAVNNQLINSGPCETNGTVAPIPYSYHLDDVSVVKSTVMAGAGAGRGPFA